jgi:hypothetical protein
MRDPLVQNARARLFVALATVTLAGTSAGCASAPSTAPGTSHGGSGFPTIGTDLRKAPRGQTVPPTALGVDMVDCSPVGGKSWARKTV